MKTTKKILSVLLAMLLIVPSLYIQVVAVDTPTPTTWNGTADTSWYNDTDTVFEISTAEELAGLAQLVNANEANTFSNKTIKLTADICLNDVSGYASWGTSNPDNTWTPIGKHDYTIAKPDEKNWYSFNGTFDGNGHTIYGMYIAGKTRSGLFATIGNLAVIKDLKMAYSYVQGYSESTAVVVAQPSGSSYTLNNVDLEYFTVNGVKNATTGCAAFIGNIGTASGVVIDGCDAANGTVNGSQRVGLVVGTVNGRISGAFTAQNIKITNCNLKQYTSNADSAGYGYIIGCDAATDESSKAGVISISNIIIENGNIEGGLFVGSIIGKLGYYKNMTIDYVSVNGTTVKGTHSGNDGGILGGIASSYGNGAVISNCYVNATVSGNGEGTGGIYGKTNTGADKMTIKNCYVQGTVTGTSRVGGFVGCFNQGNVSGYLNVENSKMDATVTGTGSSIGGVMGDLTHDAEKITVSNTIVSGSLKGTSLVGAVVGRISCDRGNTGIITLTNFYYDANFNGATPTLLTTSGTYSSEVTVKDGATFYTPLSNTETATDASGVVAKSGDGENFAASLDSKLWSETTPITTPATTTETSWYTANTSSSAFYIRNAAQLKNFAALVNGGTTFSGKTVYLVNDITLNDVSNFANWVNDASGLEKWTPIGTDTSSQRFEGTFNGQGYKVIGMYIAPDAISGIGNYGFFSMLQSGANFSNFTLENAYVNHNSGCVAIVFGQTGSVGTKTLSNITVKDSVIKTTSGSGVGVFTGKMNGATTLTFDNCDIINTKVTATQNVGGMLGLINNSNANIGTLAITDCDVDMDITATGDNVGGFVGLISSVAKLTDLNFTDCTVKGDISSDTNCVAGFVGRTNVNASGANPSSISFKNCDTTGLTLNGAMRLSDCVGYTRYYVTAIKVDGCKLNADLISTSTENGRVIGGTTASGSNGCLELLEVKNSSSAGTISGSGKSAIIAGSLPDIKDITITNYEAKDTITITGNYAGLIGSITNLDGTATFEDVSFIGTINGATSSLGLGGMIGRIDSYDEVSFTNCDVNVEITGKSQIGGFIGYVANGSQANALTFTDCTTENEITKVITEVGGLIGCYYTKGDNSEKAITISGCETNDTIIADGDTTSNKSGIGGLIGVINSSASATNIEVNISDTDVSGTMDVAQNSAAMIGWIKTGATVAELNVTDSSSEYTITGTPVIAEDGKTYIANAQCIGSILGLSQTGIATTTIDGYNANDTLSGKNGAIGVLGMAQNFGTITATDVIVTNRITTEEIAGGFIGKLIGGTAVTVNGFYFDGKIDGFYSEDGETLIIAPNLAGGLIGSVTPDGGDPDSKASVIASNAIILGTITAEEVGALAGDGSNINEVACGNFYYDIVSDNAVNMLGNGFDSDIATATYKNEEEDVEYITTYCSPSDKDNLPTADFVSNIKTTMPEDIQAIQAVDEEETNRLSSVWVDWLPGVTQDKANAFCVLTNANPAYATSEIVDYDEYKDYKDEKTRILGASIRITPDYGFRFASRFNDDAIKEIKEVDVATYEGGDYDTFGTIITTEAFLGENEALTMDSASIMNIPARVSFGSDNASYMDGYKTFNGTIVDIPDFANGLKLYVRGYVKFKDGTIMYTDTIARTYEGVAKACYKDQTEAVQKALVEKFGDIFG